MEPGIIQRCFAHPESPWRRGAQQRPRAALRIQSCSLRSGRLSHETHGANGVDADLVAVPYRPQQRRYRAAKPSAQPFLDILAFQTGFSRCTFDISSEYTQRSAVDAETKIQAALSRIGDTDILTWARQYPTVSLVDLGKMLNAGVPRIDVQRFMADEAQRAGRYDDFVRTEAIRLLNEYFAGGIGGTKSEQYAIATGGTFWSRLFEPSKHQLASETWDELIQALKNRPDWCPTSPDDESVLRVFQGRSFAPSEGARKLAEAVRRMEEERLRGNRLFFSESRAAKNFRKAPRGYGWLYGLYSVDGQVNNGGFLQYYENMGGVPTPFAIEGFRAIGREHLASIVEESLASAFRFFPELLSKNIAPPTFAGSPRSLDELDATYYEANKREERCWLDLAMAKLVIERASEF